MRLISHELPEICSQRRVCAVMADAARRQAPIMHLSSFRGALHWWVQRARRARCNTLAALAEEANTAGVGTGVAGGIAVEEGSLYETPCKELTWSLSLNLTPDLSEIPRCFHIQ
jgi:hypothetical protein